MQTILKRRDQFIACALAPIVLLLLAILFFVVLVCQGRPFLYSSVRMKDVNTSFRLYKIRTMRPDHRNLEGVLGGNNQWRVTRLGRVLRRTRLDELPQIFNVIRGDIGFIGPRPPLQKHVVAFPTRFEKVFSKSRPGITGLATVTVHRREEKLLSRCNSAEEAEMIYIRRCLPLKLRIDAIYARKRSFWLDALIVWRTFARLRPVQFPRLRQDARTRFLLSSHRVKTT